jgi:signal transduction histidine kinase
VLPFVLSLLAIAIVLGLRAQRRSRSLDRELSLQRQTLAETRTRLELINSIATRIHAGMDADEIVESSVRQIGEAFPGLRTAWSTVDEGVTRVVYSFSPRDRGSIGDMVTDLGASVPDYLRDLERGLPIAVRDVLSESRLQPLARWFTQRGSRAVLDVPVVVNGTLTALLYLDSSEVRDWSPHELGVLREAAEYLSLAITDAQLHEEQTRIQTSMLHAQKLESLGVLAGGIAHDFNNLLTGVLGNACLGLDEAQDERCRELFGRINRAALRASDLTGQMLAYSGRSRYEHDRVNLSELVSETATLLDASTSGVSVIDYRLDEDLPALEGDSGQIQQVVMNLITNASEAMAGSDGCLRLETGTQELDETTRKRNLLRSELQLSTYVFVEVADEGCGMPPEVRGRMFDPFYTTKFTGRGLGLAAVLGIVRAHHGAILVDSDPERGTVIRVLFPASSPRDLLASDQGVILDDVLSAGTA